MRRVSVMIKIDSLPFPCMCQDIVEIEEDQLSGMPEKAQKERIQMIVDERVLGRLNYEWEDVTDCELEWKPDAYPHFKFFKRVKN